MPSSKAYTANRKSKYKHEEAMRKKREATKGDPKATKPIMERARLRKALNLKKGDPRHAGHTGAGTLAKKLKGRTAKGGLGGKRQGAKSNMSAGGKVGNSLGKSRGAAIGRKNGPIGGRKKK